MILTIILIYSIAILIILLTEFYSLFKLKKQNLINIYPESKLNLTQYKYNKDLNLYNYEGYFKLVNNYGFYIYNNEWNIIINNMYYEFKVPVNIKIININYNLIYYK